MTLKQLQDIKEKLGCILLKLPQREIGGKLPPWDELVEMTSWIKEQNIPIQLDGARLWEIKPYYQKSYKEISNLFDSVYVSFYKIIGGITGAVLAGLKDFIEEAKIWQRRHGGNLRSLYPYVLSAKLNYEKRINKMQLYYEKAVEIVSTFSEFPEIEISPSPLQTNVFHCFLKGDRKKLEQAALDIAKKTKIWLFGELRQTEIPCYSKLEFAVGDATLDLELSMIKDLFTEVFEKSSR